jgi:hypothetical protein
LQSIRRVTLERDRRKEREIPEGSGKTKLAQDSLKTYDLMKKHDFVYIGFRDHKNIIYENVTNYERLEDLMKMFSNDLY